MQMQRSMTEAIALDPTQMQIPGASLAFGGKRLTGHSIPPCYGAFEPTAVFVPLQAMLESDAVFDLATTELFGPFQVPASSFPGAGQ